MQISNPVLTGFHADPSMIRVGDTYYIANSTFEWFPGVRLHESKDLVHWNTLPSPLSRVSQLDMKGNPSSGGIWAPDLSYADGRFWLIYTDVKVVNGAFKDCVNYLVTADDIRGPWSDPIRINGVGFDSSLFHDDDGRKYLVQQTWDFREYHHSFNGITLTEFDVDAMRLKPETARTIWDGTAVKVVEGPHLYRKDGWYYLFAAEGGTQYEHQESVARSTTIPSRPCLTVRSSVTTTLLTSTCKSRDMVRSWTRHQGSGITRPYVVARGVMPSNRRMACAAGARLGAKPPFKRWSGMRMAGLAWSEAVQVNGMWTLQRMPLKPRLHQVATNMTNSNPTCLA